MRRHRRVILMIESSRAYGRGCLMGIARYLRTHQPWHVLHLERSLEEDVPAQLSRWNGDGIIARIENERMATAIAALGLPTVDLRGRYRPAEGCMLNTDPLACARLAAEHFLQRGFRRFAFCGYHGLDFSDRRREAFTAVIAQKGFSTIVYEDPVRRGASTGTLESEARGEMAMPSILKWLKSLPTPTAIFACNDIRGRQVLAACDALEMKVPNQIAVLGVDNDPVVCELSSPPLSSIEPDTTTIGHESARMLDLMMAGDMPESPEVLIAPTRIVARYSTDGLAIDDFQVASSLRFIRDHACDGINVGDVIERANLSRSTLERRFQVLIGHSPKKEIERVRMEQVCRILIDTTYSLENIADLTGFKTAAHLANAFKQLHGVTPGQFRRTTRDGSPDHPPPPFLDPGRED